MLKSDLRGIETILKLLYEHLHILLKSDLRGIETHLNRDNDWSIVSVKIRP